MFGRHARHSLSNFVEPDLPITPMLDMSFQLLAFFISTFNPTPLEGHLDMALPPEKGGATASVPSIDPSEDKEEYTVRVEPDESGGVSAITLLDRSSAEGKALGADSAALFDELKNRLKTNGKDAKIRLEMGDNLSYKLVIKIMDEIQRAGYKQVAPTLHEPDKK